MHRVDFTEKFSAALGSLSGVMASFFGPFVSRLRATPHVLWYYLHTSYLPRAWMSMDLNLIVACEVLRVVDELLMNPINFHVDPSSHLINGCSD
jgi:hypothetical protein